MDAFRALSLPVRREIVELLATRGQMSASEISSSFPMTPAAISQHLKVLRESRVLAVQKEAQRRLYSLNPVAMDELGEWAATMKATWQARLDQLDAILSD